MAVSCKGTISFGLVHIPITLYAASQDNGIRFNQFCKNDHSRIRDKKPYAFCGKELLHNASFMERTSNGGLREDKIAIECGTS